jgi:L-asparagine oxygenase
MNMQFWRKFPNNHFIHYYYYKMSDHIIELSQEEQEILEQLASRITTSPSRDPEWFCLLAKSLSEYVPHRIVVILKEFSSKGNRNGFLLIKTSPSANYPKTPSDNTQKIGETTILARIQSIIVSVISEMIAYEAEGYGRLFQDVVPIKSMASDQTSVGSNVELEIHTEQAFSKLRPDILSLACIRGDINAMTHILPVQRIIDTLDSKILRESLWKTGVDLSFKLKGNEFLEGDIRGPLPIIHGSESDPWLTFDQDLMTGETPESEAMIKQIVDIYYKQRISHNLVPGDIVLIDNRRAVHGRSPFFPRYDDNDRFLIRCFGTMDYPSTRRARPGNGRVISAIYS